LLCFKQIGEIEMIASLASSDRKKNSGAPDHKNYDPPLENLMRWWQATKHPNIILITFIGIYILFLVVISVR